MAIGHWDKKTKQKKLWHNFFIIILVVVQMGCFKKQGFW